MAKWLMAVGVKGIDKARDNELKEWYDKTHFPDVLEVSGYVRATRYENIEPSEETEILALYEIETDDINSFMKAHTANMDKKRAQGRLPNLYTRTFRGVFKLATSVPAKKSRKA